jgi:FKBP-type peptidyl-prolyl cis-trans isomerase FkpA
MQGIIKFTSTYMPFMSRLSTAIYLCALLSSCRQDTSSTEKSSEELLTKHSKGVREQFMQANQQLMQKENDEMDYYVRSHQMPFIKTSSGIRYYVYKPSVSGDSIRDGMRVRLTYKLYLLDGTLAYSSEKDGVREFIIGQEDIESGIHKGLQFLKKGDKALLIIPSPLAHGLLGDMKRIPPQMPIVYDVLAE